MTEKIEIDWTMGVQVKGGPRISLSDVIAVDAYDMIEVEIEVDADDKEVQIHPAGPEQIQLVLIRSDQYGDDLTYKVGTGGTKFELDAPHLFIGKGALAILGAGSEALFFSNGLGDPASIQVLVGRKATPLPSPPTPPTPP